MSSTTRLATLTVLALLGLTGTASADTYCVASPAACPAGVPSQGDLQVALKAAQDHKGHDTVLVGAGTYSTADGFFYYTVDAENTVELVGEGDATVLQGSTPAKTGSFEVLQVTAPAPSRVAGVHVIAPGAVGVSDSPAGILVQDGTDVEDVRVTDVDTAPSAASYGITVEDGGDVRRAEVDVADGVAGVRVSGEQPVEITDSTITAGLAVRSAAVGATMVRRSTLNAYDVGVSNCGASMDVESSVIRVLADNGSAIIANACNVGASVNGSHLTMIASGYANTFAVQASTAAAVSTNVKIDNSILFGFAVRFKRTTSAPGGAVVIHGANINSSSGSDVATGTGSTNVVGGMTQKVGFVEPASGDYRIQPASLMVDAGRSDSFVALGGTDRSGAARSVGARRDLGAYEYQALAPVAAIGGATTVTVGEPLTLSGAQSRDDDAGDSVTSFAWNFGDGASAAERDVSHAWSQPGTYAVALTVTDETGKTNTATTDVVVTAPPVVPGGGGATGGGETTGGGGEAGGGGGGTGGGGVSGGDVSAPTIDGLRLQRARGLLRLRLSEAATLGVRVERRSGTRFRAASTAKPVAGKAGANSVKVATKRLRPGRYRLVVTATDAAGNRTVRRLAFRVA
jgi:PKD repeat protein